jgi:hypothetical protein
VQLQSSNPFTVQAVEVAGNQSAISAKYTVSVNQAPQAPQIQGFSPAGTGSFSGFTGSQTPTIFGTTVPGNYVEVFQNGAYVGYVQASSSGSWSYASHGLPDGQYCFTAMSLSPGGLCSTCSNACNFTVNTQAPHAPAILGITPDSGTPGDNITNSQHISLFGTAGPGLTISLYQGASSTSPGVYLGSTTSNSNGNWVFNYSQTTLPAGSYVFTATATNFAGNTSQPTQGFNVTIDLTPPPSPSVTSIKNDSGRSSTDAITNVQGQVFLGKTIPNGIVQVFVDGNSIGTVAASGDGTWAFDYSKTNLNEGTHAVTAEVTDYVGNVSAMSMPLQVVIDLTAPNKPVVSGFTPDTGVSNTDGITNDNTPTVFGTAEANSLVSLYNGNHFLASTIASATGSWSISFQNQPLSDGSYSLQATATDVAGNISQMSSNAVSMTIITKIGNVQIKGISPDTGLHNNDGITNATNIKIFGQSDRNDTIQVFQNGVFLGTTTADGNGNWTFDNTKNTLAQGTYQFTAVASDVAGNASPVSQAYQVVIDTTPPAAPTIAAVTETTDNNGNQTLVLMGLAVPQSQVTVYLGSTVIATGISADGQGNWSFNYQAAHPLTGPAQFANGTYLFTATDMDVAGNVSTASAAFKLLLNGNHVPNAPHLTGSSVLSTDINNFQTAVNPPTFTGNAPAGSKVTILDGNTVLGTVVADSHGNWTFTCTGLLGKGHHSVAFFTTDSFGTESLLSNALQFQV